MKDKKKLKEIKSKQKFKKDVGTTLNWMHIDRIEEDAIILKKDKRVEVVQGIKIKPKNILIENESTQERLINEIRGVFNRISFPIYHQFVYSKVNIINHYNHLLDRLQNETNPAIRELIEDDIEKADAYSQNYQELSFFLLISSNNAKTAEKNLHDLRIEIERTGLEYDLLLKSDFQNLCTYLFENDLINDYYFTTGYFECLKENSEFNKEVLYDI